MVAIITDEVRTVEAEVRAGRVLLSADALRDGLGWELKPQGLCQGDVCVPVRDQSALFVDDLVDVAAVADALRRPVVVDADAGVVAMALGSEGRQEALDARH